MMFSGSETFRLAVVFFAFATLAGFWAVFFYLFSLLALLLRAYTDTSAVRQCCCAGTTCAKGRRKAEKKKCIIR